MLLNGTASANFIMTKASPSLDYYHRNLPH